MGALACHRVHCVKKSYNFISLHEINENKCFSIFLFVYLGTLASPHFYFSLVWEKYFIHIFKVFFVKQPGVALSNQEFLFDDIFIVVTCSLFWECKQFFWERELFRGRKSKEEDNMLGLKGSGQKRWNYWHGWRLHILPLPMDPLLVHLTQNTQ